MEANAKAAPTPAAMRSRMVSLWKAGAKTPEEFVPKTAGMVADPARVTLPFLSILGTGDSQVFARQAQTWHGQIRSTKKSFVLLDAASGADGHVQVNNRLRLCQECVGRDLRSEPGMNARWQVLLNSKWTKWPVGAGVLVKVELL